VNAAFFGLAFTAALNPKLLGADVLIIENRRPRDDIHLLPGRRPGDEQSIVHTMSARLLSVVARMTDSGWSTTSGASPVGLGRSTHHS
jgi:hypothetical protein